MCGIAGIIGFSNTRVDAAVADRMADTLTHRGPDQDGHYLSPRGDCALSFRRLAIIDLAAGNQPIANEDESVWCVFNGEIYNFKELRRGLQARGHTFRTDGDSEVLVHLWEECGTEMFAQLSGMFAIALWDTRTRKLVLARDRFGKKPLLFAEHENRLYFASELKALRAADIPLRIDPGALHAYFLFQYVPAPESIFEGVRKLEPATFLEIDAAAGNIAPPRRYYELPHPAEIPRDEREALGQSEQLVANLKQTLRAAVDRRLIADVPLGAFLSGGIDSSLVVALMHELGVAPLRTFSIGFPDARYDETRYARAVAEHLGTEHHEQIVTPDAVSILDTLAHYYDEPFADSSAIPTYYVARFAREHVTVVLTGDGGDEAFLGYDRYRAARVAAELDLRLPRWLRRAGSAAARWLPRGNAKSRLRRAFRFLSALGLPPARRYFDWIKVCDPAALQAGYQPGFAARLNAAAPLDWFQTLHDSPARLLADERANRIDYLTYLPYDLLTKVDIATMACSLEARCPLLDPAVVRFGMSVDVRHRRDKQLLKALAYQLLPRDVIDRPKMGFGVPIGEWFRGPLRPLLEERLHDTAGICAQIFDPAWLQRFADQHLSARENHAHPLWALLMLDAWSRRWDARL